MNRAAFLLLGIASGCNPVYVDLLLGRYDYAALPPVCFEQDGLTFRSEACPDPGVTHTAAIDAAALGITTVAIFDGWTVALVDDVEGAVGATTPHDRLVVIETVDVLRHELFHVVLWETTGDLDVAHTDARWEGL